VPLDGSPFSEQALATSAALANAAGATIHLATVTPPVSTVEAPPGGFADGAAAASVLDQGMRAYLEAQADVLRAAAPAAAVACAVLDGPTARSLSAYARAFEVDLVVMTSHGWGGIKRLWLGSVADELLRRVRSPVLLLRPTRSQPAIGFHRVLVALDASPECESIMNSAVALGTLVPAVHYTLVEVLEPPSSRMLRLPGSQARTGSVWVEHRRAAVTARLEQFNRRLRRRGVDGDVRVLVGQGVAEQILELARNAESDLLVIGTRAPHEVERLVFGSVADKILRGATQPVLVVPLTPSARGEREQITTEHRDRAHAPRR
jgi:nucleotide-binding universal stress UspA family protein